MSKRELISRLLSASGMLGALERLPGRPRLAVLCCHRLGDPASSPLDNELFSASSDGFRELLHALVRKWRIFSREEILSLPDSLQVLREPALMVTFDDAYRDNYDLAAPILEDLGLPGVFFVPTRILDHPELPWCDQVAYLIKHTQRESIELEYPAKLKLACGPADRLATIQRVLYAFRVADSLDYAAALAAVEEATGVQVGEAEQELAANLFMHRDHVRDLHQRGHIIGSHTHTHRILSHLTADAQRTELRQSRQLLADLTGQPPDLFAYPVGGPTCFTRETQELVRQVGYRAAFSYYGGLVKPDHSQPYNIPRETVDFVFNTNRLRARLQARRWCNRAL